MEWKTLLHPPPTNKELKTKFDIGKGYEVKRLVFDGKNWRDSQNKVTQTPTHWRNDR